MTMQGILSALDTMEASTLDLETLVTELESRFVQMALLIETQGEDEFFEDDVVALSRLYVHFRAKHLGTDDHVSGDHCEELYNRYWEKTYTQEMGEKPHDTPQELDWRRFDLPQHIVVRIARAAALHHVTDTKAWYAYVKSEGRS